MHIHRRSSLGLELPLGGGVLLAHFQNTQTAQLPGGGLVSGIQSSIATLPADFEQTTVLVTDTGINRVCETWGRALLAFGGKTPVANDTTVVLGKFGYWTDSGAAYHDTTAPGRFTVAVTPSGTTAVIRLRLAEEGTP